jgi:2-methylcitrate dehydratase PrpD
VAHQSSRDAEDAEPGRLAWLAEEAGRMRLEDVPGPVLEHARRVFADTLGVVMGGARQPEMRSLLAPADAWAGGLPAGPCQVLAPRLPSTTPAEAAFLNGTAGTFLELDEGVRPTGHPAVHVIPAALAAAQALHAGGSELLGAVLAGYEVTARLFDAYRLRYPLHPHGHLGAVGAAVAVARLRGRPPAGPALVAATLPLLTVWQPCFEGATTRNTWSGFAAAVGVTANRLAEAGFTGSSQLESVAFGELVGEVRSLAPLTEPIDPGELRITRDYLKLHSACALSHGAIDAVLGLGAIDPDEVLGLEVETVENNLKLDRQALDNSLSTRFSIPYAVAAAIVHRESGPRAFLPDPAVQALAARVEVRAASDLEAAWPERSPTRVTVRCRERVLRAEVANPHGHHLDPASPDELRAKFEGLTWSARPSALYERLLAVDEVADAGRLFEGVA